MPVNQKRENKKNLKNILREYSSKFELYNDFAASVRRLMFLFLKAEKINFHSITFRAKEVYSLKQKIKRKLVKGRIYSALGEISDLAGVRVILHFKSDIAKVVEIINREFFVHDQENVDKDNLKNSEQNSGYTSIHRIISLDKNREALKEYNHFGALKCEIQIRTVLQHAWAEIEHSIGYKPSFHENSATSKSIKKIFKSTARQLARADANFVNINDKYNELMRKYTEKINKRKLNIPINAESIESYLVKKGNFQKIPDAKNNLLIAEYLAMAENFQIKTIKELDKLISEKEGTNE